MASLCLRFAAAAAAAAAEEASEPDAESPEEDEEDELVGDSADEVDEEEVGATETPRLRNIASTPRGAAPVELRIGDVAGAAVPDTPALASAAAMAA